MAESLIRVENLVTHYGDTKILDDISFEVETGEIFLIIGGSGCGKTTLLKHMADLLSPTSGAIYFEDQSIAELSEDELAAVQQDIGIAFQSGALFNSMTVGENVALPLREYRKVDAQLIPAIVRMKLSLVGLAEAENQLPGALSGGMRKRAGLARALAADPPVVFFRRAVGGP
jgi:phospholipid/cholesterol/gamma-HCH transport system ATP-binding protein